MENAMVLVFNEDGTGSYDLMNNYCLGTFTWTEADGTITFADVTGNATLTTATVAEGVISCTCVIDGGEIACDYTK